MTLLMQAAVAADSLLSHAATYGIGALCGLASWQLKVTQDLRDEVRRLRQWAFGPEGNNGVNSQVKQHEDRLDHLEDITPHFHARKTDR